MKDFEFTTIVEVERRTDGTLLTLACGHQSLANQIYTHKLGARTRCYRCVDPEGYGEVKRPTGQLMEHLKAD